MGLYLNRYASSIGRLMQWQSEEMLENALGAQRSFWRLVGILILAAIGLNLLVMGLGLAFGLFVASR